MSIYNSIKSLGLFYYYYYYYNNGLLEFKFFSNYIYRAMGECRITSLLYLFINNEMK